MLDLMPVMSKSSTGNKRSPAATTVALPEDETPGGRKEIKKQDQSRSNSTSAAAAWGFAPNSISQ